MMKKKADNNRCYFLCLLDWRDFLLSKGQIDQVAKALGLPVDPSEPPTGWHVGPCEGIAHDAVQKATIGMAHSRIIFQFEFGDIPLNDFWQIRRIREQLESQVTAILQDRAIPAMQTVLKDWVRGCPDRGGPRIFVYPVFEVRSSEPFWKNLQEEKPFNLPTTCFHTRLHDLEAKKTVKMRVSGAKIIATEMSNHFFWELVNVVYYQGLYRQSRESPEPFAVNRVHRSLENRLEEFGQTFATTFYELGSARMLEQLNSRLVRFTVLLVSFTVVLVVLTLTILGITLATLVLTSGD